MGRFVAAALCALAVTGTTFAQEEKQPPGERGRGGRGGGQFGRGGFGMFGGAGSNVMQILEMPQVQDELKLTADEKGNIPLLKEELTEGDRKFNESLGQTSREERMAKMSERRAEVDKQIKEVLGDKYARFRQIRLQLDGLFASVMADKEVKDALNFTDDQRTQMMEAMRPPEGGGFRFSPGERPDLAKMQEMRAQMEKRQQEALDKVLTAEQKKKWEEMIGAKITYKRPAPQFGQGRGPGGPGGSGGEGRGRRGRRGEGENPPPGGDSEKKPPFASSL